MPQGCTSIGGSLASADGATIYRKDCARCHGPNGEGVAGVLDERARSVFTGRIIVRPGAQRTDYAQLNGLAERPAAIDATVRSIKSMLRSASVTAAKAWVTSSCAQSTATVAWVILRKEIKAAPL